MKQTQLFTSLHTTVLYMLGYTVTVHLPCVFFLSWSITRPHFRGKQFHENSKDHKIILKEVGVGSETSQISMDFYKGFKVLYHSSTILLFNY